MAEISEGQQEGAANESEASPEVVCNSFRASLLNTEKVVRAMVGKGPVVGEAAAQAMLAVRHLEDARMRLGKVIQHTAGGGVSCWDSERKPADDGR